MASVAFKFGKRAVAVRVALVVSSALFLTACQTDGAGPVATDAPKAGSAGADIDASTTQATRPQPHAEPMTRSRAARECWMRTERGAAREDLDKRADVVNRCIEEKMKAAGTAAPKT